MINTTLNVLPVRMYVKPVSTVTHAKLAKNTEPKPHQNVHVKPDIMIVTTMVNVANVLTIVPPVLKTPLNVSLVPREERTTLQLVIAQMMPLKSKKPVSHVTKRDVKPVLDLLITVPLVNPTELMTQPNVHVQMDNGKTKTKTVKNVTTNVKPVKTPKTNVLNALESELKHQNVSVHMVTSKTT